MNTQPMTDKTRQEVRVEAGWFLLAVHNIDRYHLTEQDARELLRMLQAANLFLNIPQGEPDHDPSSLRPAGAAGADSDVRAGQPGERDR